MKWSKCMSDPLVGILIPCFNCEAWIGQAIQSALNQSWKRKEILVIDDGSTDGSWQVINSFGAAIRCERHANQGPSVTRNRLLALSQGDWIQFLDADDELAADKIERQLEHRDVAQILFGSLKLVWFEGKVQTRQTETQAEFQEDDWSGWFKWAYPNPTACLFRRDLLEKVNGWDVRYKLLCEDYALLSRLLFAKARMAATPDAWSIYRQWSSTQSVNKHKAALAEIRLDLMLEVAGKLQEQGELKGERRKAFVDSAFGVVRTLYAFKPESGRRAWSRLKKIAGSFTPSPVYGSAAYRFLFRHFGFGMAERVSHLRRDSLTDAGFK
jgi:glycosyltransferase involved in cell wall biosynthesis